MAATAVDDAIAAAAAAEATRCNAGPASVSASEVARGRERSLAYFASIQRARGEWEAEVVWSPVLLAQYLMVRAMVRRPFDLSLRDAYLRYFDTWQTPEGGWGMHHESPAYLFVTTLVYVALRTLGVSPDDERLVRARALIKKLGTPTCIPTWGKLWLAFFNLYEYTGIQAIPPEIWLLPRALPVHPSRYYCHTRLIYLGMCYLHGRRFRIPEDDFVRALRRELYEQPYESIDFATARGSIARRDLFDPPSPLLRAAYEGLRFFDAHHPERLRAFALKRVLTMIEAEQRSTRYAAVSPVNGLLNTLALYASDPEHPDFEPSLRGADYWQWRDEHEGLRYNGARSQTWDTGFAVQAALAAGASAASRPSLMKAAQYLSASQILEEPDPAFYRDTRIGGWCFSDEHHGWPVSDTTAEALAAVLALRDAGIESIGDERIEAAARFILTRQNPDGGWGSYERQRSGLLLEYLNPSEMFGNCMVEHSYIECTASSIEALAAYLAHSRTGAQQREARQAIRRGQRFILGAQDADGSWPGFWGINYTYGTWFAIRGLRAAGVPADAPPIRRACDWLVGHQKADGGWGEHWTSCLAERYLEHPDSQVIMTAWAVMALLLGEDPRRDAIARGVRLLLSRQRPDGSWPKEAVAGVFFNTAMHHYELYRDYFPLWALGLWQRYCCQSASNAA